MAATIFIQIGIYIIMYTKLARIVSLTSGILVCLLLFLREISRVIARSWAALYPHDENPWMALSTTSRSRRRIVLSSVLSIACKRPGLGMTSLEVVRKQELEELS